VSDCNNHLQHFLVIAALLRGDTPSGVDSRVLRNRSSPVVQPAHSCLVTFQYSGPDHTTTGPAAAGSPDRTGGLFCVNRAVNSHGIPSTPLARSDLAYELPNVGDNSAN